jgi:hypothetical protein
LVDLNSFRLARGVGSNGEDPVAKVRGADGCSGNTVPDSIKPERGQGLEDFLPDQSFLDGEEVGDVLQDDVRGSKFAHDSGHLSPQNGLGVIEAGTESSRRDPFAREAADDTVHRCKIASTEFPNVRVYRYVRPTLSKYLAPPGVGLAEPDVLDPGLSKSGVEQSDAGEETSESEHLTPPP